MLFRGEIVQEDVWNAGPVGDERQVMAIRRPLRVQIEPILIGQHFSRAAMHVVHGDPPLGELEQRKVAFRAAVGGEGDVSPVRRPRRLQIRILVVGELLQILSVGINDIEVGDSATSSAERDLSVVRRKHGTPYGVDRQVDPLLHRSRGDVNQIEDVLSLPLTGEGESSTIIGERAL